MFVGAIARKTRILDDSSVRRLTDFVLTIVTPCLIISAFQRPFIAEMLPGLGWAFALGAFGHIAGILVAHLLIHNRDERRRRVLRFATVFSNAGFMGLPLEYALFGSDGVFYGIAYVAMFNLFCWTYGVWEIGISGESGGFNVKMLLNPGTISLAIGLPLFFLPWRLPDVVSSPLSMIAALNTPVPMIVIGYQLAGANFLPAIRCRATYLMLVCRHFIVPLLMIAAVAGCGFIDPTVRLVSVIASAAPIGVLLTMFTLKAKGDVDYSTAAVSLSTLLSILTLPLMVGLARGLLR